MQATCLLSLLSSCLEFAVDLNEIIHGGFLGSLLLIPDDGNGKEVCCCVDKQAKTSTSASGMGKCDFVVLEIVGNI